RGAVARGGEHGLSAATQRRHEAIVQAVGAERREPHLAAAIDDGLDDVRDLRVIRGGGADEPHARGVLGDEREHALHLEFAHTVVGGATHHAVHAAAVAAALGL